MDITLAQIDEFIKQKGISERGFCKLCGESPSWLSKIRSATESKYDVLILSKRNLASITKVLSGDVTIPDSALRHNNKRNISSIPNDHIITNLVNEVFHSGKNITFLEFIELCETELRLKEIRRRMGLKQSG